MEKTKFWNKDRTVSVVGPIILFFVIFFGVQAFVIALKIPAYIMPTPVGIFESLGDNFTKAILPEALKTLQVIMLGYIIGFPVGILLAAVTSQFNILNQTLSPITIILVCTPLISLVPLLMLTMGIGMNVRVIAVFLQVFPIVNMNAFTGFNNVETIKLELMQSMGAKRWTKFFRVVLPDALPHVFTGLKLGTILATTTAISTEIVAGSGGLGNLIMVAKGTLKTDLVLATVLVCACIGIILYTVVTLVEKKMVKWSI